MNLTIIFYVLGIILFISAIFFELCDWKSVHKYPHISTLKSSKDKVKWYKRYASFEYQNGVYWKRIYVSAFLGCLVLIYLTKRFYPDINISLSFILVVIASFFIPMYIFSSLRHFHMYRVLASKVSNELYTINDKIH